MLAENIMDDAWPGFQGREWGVWAGRFVCPKEFLGVAFRIHIVNFPMEDLKETKLR